MGNRVEIGAEDPTFQIGDNASQARVSTSQSGALCLLPESIKLAECSKGSRISPIFPVLFVDPPEEGSNSHA